MQGESVLYNGRLVPKENFRVYIFSLSGEKKLVNSWDEYQSHMECGLWFSTEKDMLTAQELEKISQEINSADMFDPPPKKKKG
jgi:hypothetical protein